MHTKITLLTTACCSSAARSSFTAFEWRNPATLGPFDAAEKLLVGLLPGRRQPRTAGFNSLDYAQVHETSLLVTDVLMFIGGGSAGTAGGIKVATFFAAAVRDHRRGARRTRRVDAFGRQVPAAVAAPGPLGRAAQRRAGRRRHARPSR